MNLYEWAKRWGIPTHAIAEFLAAIPDSKPTGVISEACIQQQVRLEAPTYGALLWRNNRGVATAENRVVRFGLANDNPQVNRRVKSSDLIGIGPRGEFVSVEVKRGNWSFSNTPEEQAQLAWINLIKARGGKAAFINHPNQLKGLLDV